MLTSGSQDGPQWCPGVYTTIIGESTWRRKTQTYQKDFQNDDLQWMALQTAQRGSASTKNKRQGVTLCHCNGVMLRRSGQT